MRRGLLLTLAIVITLGWGLHPALAQSPHFAQAAASGPDESGVLTVNFRLVGLAATGAANVVAVSEGTAIYACGSSDGTLPPDPTVQEHSETLVGSGDFTGRSKGQLTGSLSLMPPPATLDCPSDLVVLLASVTYTGVTVIESASGSERAVPGTFSRMYVAI